MNIWVFSQEANGAPTTATLELLTKARRWPQRGRQGHRLRRRRRLGHRRLARRVRGREGLRHRRSGRQAARRGRVGGDEGRHRRRRHARPHHVPADLRGPRRHEPPVGEARPHGAHQQRRHHRRRWHGQRHHPHLRRQRARHHRLLRPRPVPRGVPPEELRRRVGRWRCCRRVAAAPVPELGATGAAQVTAVHVEEPPPARSSTRPPSWSPVAVASARPPSTRWSRRWPSCSRAPRAPREPSSTPAGCPTATRSARPARS